MDTQDKSRRVSPDAGLEGNEWAAQIAELRESAAGCASELADSRAEVVLRDADLAAAVSNRVSLLQELSSERLMVVGLAQDLTDALGQVTAFEARLSSEADRTDALHSELRAERVECQALRQELAAYTRTTRLDS
jgi:hypothetical protein